MATTDPCVEHATAATKILAVLAEKMRDGRFPRPRAIVAAQRLCPEEGLALLGAYVAIEDRAARQALLDAVTMIAGHPPRR